MKKDDPPAARILLVDDNSHGLTARKMILMDHGYGVETALSGEEAWDIFQKHHFDIVVTDLRMSGIEKVMQGMGRGKITASDGEKMMNVLQMRSRIIDSVEVESRIAKLEESMAANKHPRAA